jgi:DNA-binding MarR family transcriptional regulator
MLALAKGLGPRYDSRICNDLNSARVPPSTQIGAILAKASSSEVRGGLRGENTSQRDPRLDLFKFVPFRLNRLAAEVSAALSSEYQERYGLDVPEWRVLATLGFRNQARSAQYIAHCTRTHKSTISRAVTALMMRQLVERVENKDDRREFALRMTRKGKALYEKLIPRLLRKEREIMSCLSASEREDFARLLGKIESSLDLVRTSAEAGKAGGY